MTSTIMSKRSSRKTRSRSSSNSIPQISHDSCHDPLTNLAGLAAVKARDAAESYFTLGNLTMAIMQAMAAKQFDPDVLGIDNFITAYMIHKAVSDKKTWYQVLGIPKTKATAAAMDFETIRKQYKRLALALHPDKNGSVAADGAFKLVKAAWDVLSDPAKREAYDKSLRTQTQTQTRTRRAASSSSSSATNSSTTRKRAAGDDDQRCYKRSFMITRKSNPGQGTSIEIVSLRCSM